MRSWIDWKYMLGLKLDDPGFDYSVLSEFRMRLIAGGAEERLPDALLEVMKAHQLIKERSRQRTDSMHILTAVRRVNTLEKVGETLRFALDDLAGIDPTYWFPRAARAAGMSYNELVNEILNHALARQKSPDGRQPLSQGETNILDTALEIVQD